MRISKTQRRHYKMPIYGAGADIPADSLVKRGATPATNNGMLIAHNGSSAAVDLVGILECLHDYSVVGDSLMNGTAWVEQPVELIDSPNIITIEFDISAANAISCTEAVNSTTMTVTSLENDIDGAFIYVVSGVGAGQTNYLTASASGSCTLKAAFGTSLDTSSKFIKILPRFHKLLSLSSDGVKLASQAAAGSLAGAILDIRIQRGGQSESLNPTKHDAITGLVYTDSSGTTGLSARDLKFEADIVLFDGLYNPVD